MKLKTSVALDERLIIGLKEMAKEHHTSVSNLVETAIVLKYGYRLLNEAPVSG
jgi:hypothetical protein